MSMLLYTKFLSSIYVQVLTRGSDASEIILSPLGVFI